MLDERLNDLLDEALPHFAGTVLVRAGGERLVIARGWANVAETVANGPETRHNTASVTKLFTAAAICRLYERGIVDFDAPASQYLGPRSLPRGDTITIDQLLSHRSGLPEAGADPAENAANDERIDWLAGVRDAELLFEPRHGWTYSNLGYAVLGAVVEAVTGLAYFDAMAELVFDPAGMDATAFDADRSEHAIPYRGPHDRRGIDANEAGIGRGAPYGYAYSSVGDIERLLLLLERDEFLSRPVAARIIRGGHPTDQAGRLAGYGAFVERFGGRTLTHTSGAGPGVSAWVDRLAESDYLAVVLSNYPKPSAHQLGQRLRDALLP